MQVAKGDEWSKTGPEFSGEEANSDCLYRLSLAPCAVLSSVRFAAQSGRMM